MIDNLENERQLLEAIRNRLKNCVSIFSNDGSYYKSNQDNGKYHRRVRIYYTHDSIK